MTARIVYKERQDESVYAILALFFWYTLQMMNTGNTQNNPHGIYLRV